MLDELVVNETTRTSLANKMSTSRQRDLIGFVEQYWNKCQLDNEHFSLRGLTHFFNFSKRYQRHINEPSPRSRWSHSTLLEQFSTRQRALLVEGVDTFFLICQRDVNEMSTRRQRDIFGLVEQYWNNSQRDNEHLSLRG